MKAYKSYCRKLNIVAEKNESFQKVKISSAKDAADYARQFYFDDLEIYESFFIILLNGANNTEAYVKISQGGTAGTVVDVKMIVKYAVDVLANGVILVHNHPSGNTQPSNADEQITQKVKEILRFLNITLFDHIIITTGDYYSFAENGLI